MLTTLKTAVGYVGTLIARKLPARLRGKEIASIFNFIPVDFKNPTQDDFDQFCGAMRDAEDSGRCWRRSPLPASPSR